MLETTRLRKDKTTVIFETDIAYSIEFAASTLNSSPSFTSRKETYFLTWQQSGYTFT